MTPRIVVVGEALVDVIRHGDQTTTHPGGSPANVAVTLGRLGRHPDLVTTLGTDGHGAHVHGWARASGVRVTAQRPANGRTSAATVTLAADGSAAYDFDLTWDLTAHSVRESGLDANVGVLHTGSIATVLGPGATVVTDLLSQVQGRALVSFDPNARPTLTPDRTTVLDAVERCVARSDLVKVSAEDLAWYYPGTDAVATARRWAGHGPVTVVVTHGGAGSTVLHRGQVTRVPGREVVAADTIGAGDTFMGALLDALVTAGVHGPAARQALASLEQSQLIEAARWATSAAALTVSRPGADPPHRAEVLAFHRRHGETGPGPADPAPRSWEEPR